MRRHRLLLTILVAGTFVSYSQKAERNKIITISNCLSIEREFETVSLSRESLAINSTDKLEQYGVKEIGTTNFLITQCVDEDGDGISDVLLFQPKIMAHSKKKLELVRTFDVPKASENWCYSRFVPERTDDYAWENNKVACRTYGPVAQKMKEDGFKGGTLTSGIDAWLKRVEYPILNKWYEKYTNGTGTYHKDTGEGLDNFHVGDSRGIGGVAVKVDSVYYFSKNFVL